MNKLSFQVESQFAEVATASSRVLDFVQARRPGERFLFDVRLAFEEALANAIEHGNRFDKSKQVEVNVSFSGDELVLRLKDGGSGFNFAGTLKTEETGNIPRPRGRGILLINHLVDRVVVEPPGNEVVLYKKIPKLAGV